MRLWDAAGITLDDAILAFTVGDDPKLDRALLPHDCLASLAHGMMLAHIGIVSPSELTQLRGALGEAFEQASQGTFTIAQEQEDCHTALEAFLTQRIGEAGKKIHTGRSRNDQVIMALRLLVRARLSHLATRVATLATSLAQRAEQHRDHLMPGYTHTRQGMPSTVGQLLGSVAEGLVSDLESFVMPLGLANRCALGSASGYGVPLPLDRQHVADSLALDGIDVNTIHVQNSRGRLEAAVLFCLHQLTQTLSRFACDLIAFSAEAYGFFVLPDSLTTGSSIMPQKRNPDVLELVRSIPSAMLGRYTAVSSLLQGLGAGYHRDLQRTKSPLLMGLNEADAVVSVMGHTVEKIEVDVQRCAIAMTNDIYATDRVYGAVRGGATFRDAYRAVKQEQSKALNATEVLGPRTHLGAPGTSQLAPFKERLESVEQLLRPYADAVKRGEQLFAS